MARPLRIEFPGAFHHVMSRGNEKQDIYRTRQDRVKFLDYLESATVRYAAVIHCYCLMDNHYHLLIETPSGNLAQIMRHINGAYTSYFNTRHCRAGHLFQGRYRSVLVDVDAYCLALSRYIHRNPVRAEFSGSPADYEWSSYQAYLGGKVAPQWLQTGFLLALIGDGHGDRKSYREYVESDDVISDEQYDNILNSRAIIGRKTFIEEVRRDCLATRTNSRDLPAARELMRRPKIQQIFEAVACEISVDHRLAKKMTIYLCHHFSGCTLKEIGTYFGVGESAVSENSNRFAMILYQDQRLAETVAGLLAELKM